MGMVAASSMDKLYRLTDRGRLIFECIRSMNVRRGAWRDEYESSARHLAMTCDSYLRLAEASPAHPDTMAVHEAAREWLGEFNMINPARTGALLVDLYRADTAIASLAEPHKVARKGTRGIFRFAPRLLSRSNSYNG
jgi:hypothetical protein